MKQMSQPEKGKKAGGTALGNIRIPRGVKADGQSIPAGTYQMTITDGKARKTASSRTRRHKGWVEFVKRGRVAGREVVTITPVADAKRVAGNTPAAANKVQMVADDDYLRVSIRRGGNQYTISLCVCDLAEMLG